MAVSENRGALWVVLCLIFGAVVKQSNGAVYKVGDSAGWTTIGNFDYKQWAASKIFRVGDIIVFEYNPQFHNVLQVTHKEYRSCNASTPISTHTTGNDSITITTRHHHFFLCGVPGHCQAGQKVDINVRRGHSRSTAPSPIANPSTLPVGGVPTLSPNVAARTTISLPFGKLGLLLLVSHFAAVVFVLFLE